MVEKNLSTTRTKGSGDSRTRDEQLMKLASVFVDRMGKLVDFFRTELPVWNLMVLVDEAHGNVDRLQEMIRKEGYSTIIPPYFGMDDMNEPWTPEYCDQWLTEQQARQKKVYGTDIGQLIDAAEVLKRHVDDPEPLIRFTNNFFSYVEKGIAVMETLPGGLDRAPTDKNGIPLHPEWHGSIRDFRDMLKQAIDLWPGVRVGLEAWLIKKRKSFEQTQKQPTKEVGDAETTAARIKIGSTREILKNADLTDKQPDGNVALKDNRQWVYSEASMTAILAGEERVLTRNQHAAIGVWWRARENGAPDVRWSRIQEVAEIAPTTRVQDTFRPFSEWRDIIVSRKRGTYRLNAPDKGRNLP